jgi:hypothetical protein
MKTTHSKWDRTAVATVRKAVAKPINGVKVMLKEPEMVVSAN